MGQEDLEPYFTAEEKETRIYKFVDLFLSDEQKESLILTVFAGVFGILSYIPIARREIMDNGRLVTATTKEHKLIILANGENRVEQVFYRSREGILAQWKLLKMPEDMWMLIRKENNMKEIKKVIGKMMKMKAFW